MDLSGRAHHIVQELPGFAPTQADPSEFPALYDIDWNHLANGGLPAGFQYAEWRRCGKCSKLRHFFYKFGGFRNFADHQGLNLDRFNNFPFKCVEDTQRACKTQCDCFRIATTTNSALGLNCECHAEQIKSRDSKKANKSVNSSGVRSRAFVREAKRMRVQIPDVQDIEPR